MIRPRILSTKTLEPTLVEQASRDGIVLIEQAAILIKPLVSEDKAREIMPWVSGGNLHYTIFTSVNTVWAVQENLRLIGAVPYWQAFAIAGRTTQALESFIGAANILATADYGKDLAPKILARQIREVVFFCGTRRREELPSMLKAAGVRVHEIVVYENIETPTVAPEDVDGILFFSPSAVQSFFSANRLKKETVCFAIGQTTAGSIAGFTDNRIIISESPSQESMLASVHFYFQHHKC